jgi:C-terminal processing protease CtpA/Prc
VVISKRTTTSAEPLVWLLKGTGRAKLFGGTTAGRPMISRPTDIGQGWDFWLAAFDFKPAVGERSGDRGVEPQFETNGRGSARGVATAWLMSQGEEPKKSEKPE